MFGTESLTYRQAGRIAMTVLANIAKQEPDLRNEIRRMMEQQMPWGSAGFKARGRKTLKELGD